jgi:hypothetical protein
VVLQVVRPLDPRIHFALVCGAKSCPPIKLYSAATLEEGLAAAADTFCASDVEVDAAARKVGMYRGVGRHLLYCVYRRRSGGFLTMLYVHVVVCRTRCSGHNLVDRFHLSPNQHRGRGGKQNSLEPVLFAALSRFTG